MEEFELTLVLCRHVGMSHELGLKRHRARPLFAGKALMLNWLYRIGAAGREGGG
jgi:hypothetical protein